MKRSGIKCGVMHKLVVYENGALVGYGFVISYPDGEMSKPDLYDIAGKELPAGLYQLTILDGHFSVVVPTRVQ